MLVIDDEGQLDGASASDSEDSDECSGGSAQFGREGEVVLQFGNFRGYELVVLGSRRSANMSKKLSFEPIAKSEKGVFKVGL